MGNEVSLEFPSLAKTAKKQGKPTKTKENPKNPRVPSRDQGRPVRSLTRLGHDMHKLFVQQSIFLGKAIDLRGFA